MKTSTCNEARTNLQVEFDHLLAQFLASQATFVHKTRIDVIVRKDLDSHLSRSAPSSGQRQHHK